MTTPSFSGCLGYKTPSEIPPPCTKTPVQLQSPTVSSFTPGPSSSILKTKSHRAGSTLSTKRVRFQDTASKQKKVYKESSDVQPRTHRTTVRTCVPKESPQDCCKVDTSSQLTSTIRPLMSPPPPASTCRLNPSRNDAGSNKAQRSQTAQQRRRRRKQQELDEDEYEVEAILDHRKTDAYPDVEYLIKWKGYPHSENSWVRVSNMNCWDLIQEYLRHVFRTNRATPNSGGHCVPSPLSFEKKGTPQSQQLASLSQSSEKKSNPKAQQSSLSVLHKKDVLCRGEVPDAKGKEERPNRRNHVRQRATSDRDPACKPQSKTTKSVTSLRKEQTQKVAQKEPTSSAVHASSFARTSRTSTKAGTHDAHAEVSSMSNSPSESPPNGCCESQPNYHAESTTNGCSEPPLSNTNCRIEVCSPPIYTSTSTTAVVYINASPHQRSAQERTELTTVGSKTVAPSPLCSPLTPGFSMMKQRRNVSNRHNSCDDSDPQYSTPASPTAFHESEPSSQESSIMSVSPISGFRLYLDSPSSDNGTASNDSEYTWSDSSLTWSVESIIDSPPSSPQASVVVINASPRVERDRLRPQLRAGNITVYPSMVPLPTRGKKACKSSTAASAVVHSSNGEYNPRDSLLRHGDVIPYKLAAMLRGSNGHSFPLVPRQRLNGVTTPSPVSLAQDHCPSLQNKTEGPPLPQCNHVEGKTKFVRPPPPSTHKVEAKTVWPSLPPSSTNSVRSQGNTVQKSLANGITSKHHLRHALDTGEVTVISNLNVSRTSPSTVQETQHFTPLKQNRPEERRDGDCVIEAWSTARLRKRSRSLSPPPSSDVNSQKRKSPRFSSMSTGDSKSVSSTCGTYHTPQSHSHPPPHPQPLHHPSLHTLPHSQPPPHSHPPPHPQPLHHPSLHTLPYSQPHPQPSHLQPHPHLPHHSRPHSHPPPHSILHSHPAPHSQPHLQPSLSWPIPHFQLSTPPTTVPTLISSSRVPATNNASYQEQLQPSPTPPGTRSSPRIHAANSACSQEQLQPSPTPPATRSSQRILAMNNTSYQEQLLEWQYELNRQRQGTEELIFVENCVDQAPTPRDFTYIVSNIYGPGVPNPDNPENADRLCGCNCYLLGKKCNSKQAKHCCPHMAGEQFPYSIAGKVKVAPGSPIFECNSKCSCPYDCANRVVQQGRMIPLCIFRTHNGRGWGVKAVEPIKANTFVTEYVGEVITSEEAERRGQQYDKKGMTYLFDLDFDDENAAFTIDAAKFGNISHFFNHSCNPNLVVYSVWIETVDPRLPRIAFFTTRNISAGEELTFDYQMNHGNSTSVSQSDTENGCIPCLCGSENCIGFLY